MLQWIVGASLRFRSLVMALAAGVLVLGITQLPATSVDILPEFMPPTVEVQTEALGLSAEEVEQLITVPLEQDLLNGVAFLAEIESLSLPGLSSVVLTFERGTNLLDARQVVAERLAQAVGVAGLPEVAKPPQMLQPLSSTSRVGIVQLSSDEVSQIEMSVLARWVISPRLLGVDGVANVAIWGFRDRQLQVLVDPARLAQQGVTLNEIIRTTGNALEVSPLSFLEASSPGTGGFIDTVNQRLHVFHEQAISTPQELAQITIENDEGEAVFVEGEPLTLGDVTQIVEDHQPLIGDALCRDNRCLLLVIEKFPAANTLEVTRGVDAALEAMRPGLTGIEIDSSVYRPASYIEAAVGNLGQALLVGMMLMTVLLGAFLARWRLVVISAGAVVLSLISAALLLHLLDAPVNALTAAGIVLALGAVIGDAVINVEHTARRLRPVGSDGAAPSSGSTIRLANFEVQGPMLFAAVIVVLATLPTFFLQGEPGAFLPSLALGYLLTLATSIVVALTVVPVLASLLLPRSSLQHRDSQLTRWVLARYDRASARILTKPRPALILVSVAVLGGLAALPFIRTSLTPSLQERDLLIHQAAPPGTSLERMNTIVQEVVGELSILPGIGNVGAHVGRAITSDQIVNVNSSEIWVSIKAEANYVDTLAAIRGVVADRRDVSSKVLTYSEQRVTAVLHRSEHDIVVRLYGQNPEVLASKAEEVHRLLARIDGVEQPAVDVYPAEPIVEVEVDLARARQFGIKPGDVRRGSAVLLSGITVGNLFEEQKVFDVVVWGIPAIRQSVNDIGQILIDTPARGTVALGDVADVRVVPRPTVIRHESVARYLDVTAEISGRSLGAVERDIEAAIAQVDFPLEYHAELLMGDVSRATFNRVISIAIAVAAGILLFLQAALRSWRLALLVFLTLPMALAGGLVAGLVDGGFEIGALAGLVAIIGFGTRNGILMIRRFQDLERREEGLFGPDLVRQGTRELLLPILLPGLATAAVLLPILLLGNIPGLEIVRPMAVVMLGGLLASLLLAVVVLPALYLRFGFISQPDLSAEELVIDLTDVDARRG